MPIPIIDLFAGPGGLNEGFSRVGEELRAPTFQTVASFEMDSSACKTLTLRSAYRYAFRHGMDLNPYYRFIRGEITFEDFAALPEFNEAFAAAEKDVHQVELGPETREISDALISKALSKHLKGAIDAPWVLIGGPPCQAYSLAGRSRRANDANFEEDKKHFLYREYLHIISEFAPPVFVMENVKGLLSSTNSGDGMFARIMNDLKNPADGLEYEVHSLAVRKKHESYEPEDFVIRAERFGIPQKRHRVILLGIKKGSIVDLARIGLLKEMSEVTVEEALSSIPALRSGVSRLSVNEEETWLCIREEASRKHPLLSNLIREPHKNLHRGSAFVKSDSTKPTSSSNFAAWVWDENIGGLTQHETRTHMKEDLNRYWFASKTAAETGVSPKLRDFPRDLLPNHANAESELRPFEDRFRVQVSGRPSTTVVSHIAKDGHYYIHPDPSQMRSLTVREAARLQTFPDNYFFCGNRTNQFTQVGNAVPPLLANQIAKVVADLFD